MVVPNILLERRDIPEKGGLMQKWGIATSLLLYSLITFTACVEGGSKASLFTFRFFSLLS